MQILEILEYWFQRSSQYANISIFRFCNRCQMVPTSQPIFEYFQYYNNIPNIGILVPTSQPMFQYFEYSNIGNIQIFQIFEYWFQRPSQYSNIWNIEIFQKLEYWFQRPSQYSNIRNIKILEVLEYCFQHPRQYSNIENISRLEILEYWLARSKTKQKIFEYSVQARFVILYVLFPLT